MGLAHVRNKSRPEVVVPTQMDTTIRGPVNLSFDFKTTALVSAFPMIFRFPLDRGRHQLEVLLGGASTPRHSYLFRKVSCWWCCVFRVVVVFFALLIIIKCCVAVVVVGATKAPMLVSV